MPPHPLSLASLCMNTADIHVTRPPENRGYGPASGKQTKTFRLKSYHCCTDHFPFWLYWTDIGQESGNLVAIPCPVEAVRLAWWWTLNMT